MSDTFQTISAPSEGLFKDRGSRFLAYAFRVDNIEDVELRLEEVKKIENKARHHCYAWRIGNDGNQFRANDDGEPSGTAGKPILGQIDSFELTNLLIVVVRYFGGTKLGTGGLINAYRTAAAEALSIADIEECLIENFYFLHFDYSLMSQVMSAVKKEEVRVVKQEFGETAFVLVGIARSESGAALLRLKARIGNLHLETINEHTQVAGLRIEEMTE